MSHPSNGRKSNFELLRIFSMLGIIMYHIVRYHIDYNRFALVSPSTGSNFYHLEFIQLFYTFGQLGNTLFILITGYFLITKKEINVIKAGSNLLLRAYLVAIVLLVASYLFVKFQLPISTTSNMHMLLKGWWFIGYYVFIIIFANYFLNNFLSRLDKKKYLTFIMVLLLLVSFTELFNVSSNLRIQNLIIGILVYAIGGFIRLYNPLKDIKWLTLCLFLALFVLIQVFQYKVNLNTNMQLFYLDQPASGMASSPFNDVLWSPSLIFLTASLVIFELFQRLNIGSQPVINKISATTFTVYLLHESVFFRQAYFKSLPLPNRIGLLKEVSTKVTKQDISVLNTPDSWLSLRDFLNISQVFQERGTMIGIAYMSFLTLIIFILGILMELLLQLIYKLFNLLFSKEIKKITQRLS